MVGLAEWETRLERATLCERMGKRHSNSLDKPDNGSKLIELVPTSHTAVRSVPRLEQARILGQAPTPRPG